MLRLWLRTSPCPLTSRFFCGQFVDDLPTVPKGGYEPSDRVLEAAASREALEEGLLLCPSPPPNFLTHLAPLLPFMLFA